MIDYIIIKTSMPDDPGLYSWTTISHYQNDLSTGYKNEPIYFVESDYGNNTIRIIELKNVLNQYDKLIERKIITSIINEEKIQEGRSLILQEIEFLEKTSQIIIEPIEEFKTLPKKIYINSGTYEARRRFKDAVKGKNEIYINNLLQLQGQFNQTNKLTLKK